MNDYPRYQVTINYVCIVEMDVSEKGIECEDVDGNVTLFPSDTICDVVIMDVFKIQSMSDVLKLFKSSKYYTTLGNSESNAFLQEFTEEPVSIEDTEEYSLDECIRLLQDGVFGKLRKPTKISLGEIYDTYQE